MYQALERHCGDVTSLGPTGNKLELAGKAVARGLRTLLHHNIDATHTVILSKALARSFRRRLAEGKFDVIFAPVAATELAYLETTLPIVYYGDLTARLFHGYAANVAGLSSWSVRQSELIERRALTRANHLVYASQWAADSAVAHYDVPREKISVVPMGANLDEAPSAEQVVAARKRLRENQCQLLFIGVDWERKGGDIALAALHELRERGINARLIVVGCRPPNASSGPELELIPFLDKAVKTDRHRLTDLLLHSDFMLFPTRREAYGIVCCEANACGLPLVVSDGGGVPVRSGENGILLPASASGREYADTIQALLADPARYMQLVEGGRKAYESSLNWDAWGRSMGRIFRHVAACEVPGSNRISVSG